MLLFGVCLILISIASNDLVDGVVDTLDKCLDNMHAVGDLLDVLGTEDDLRRREEKDDIVLTGKKAKLETCAAIVGAVDLFREYYFQPPFGDIALRLSETIYLNKLLKDNKKKLGDTLYVASKDGDAASDFHSACDEKGPSVIIVETTSGTVFGGYTDVSWSSKSTTYVKSSTSFLFQLRPSMTQYPIKASEVSKAVHHNSATGPTFGSGHDFSILSNTMSTTSHARGGYTYIFPETPSYEFGDGERFFFVKDYVVTKALAL